MSSAVKACHMYAAMRIFATAASREECAVERRPYLEGGQSMRRGESLATMIARCRAGVWSSGM